MLQKQHRLTAAMGNGAMTAKNPFFILKFRENSSEYSRFGFVVSKRVAKSAVLRNRTKRIVRSAVEQSLEQIKSGYDILFIITKPLEESLEVKKAIQAILKTKHLWQNT